jgi:DNA-binding response OmpR family regulator
VPFVAPAWPSLPARIPARAPDTGHPRRSSHPDAKHRRNIATPSAEGSATVAEVADVLLISERDDEIPAFIDALTQGGHRVTHQLLDDPTALGTEPTVVLVSAVKDLTRGRDACRALRARDERVQIIALVPPESIDAVGADWGIDSFAIWPTPIDEMLARIRLALQGQVTDTAGAVRVGDLTIDPETYQVRLRARPLDLTYKEFQLLLYLAQRPGRVFSRQQLLQEVWGYDFFGGTRTVDVHVRRLRAKLGAEHEGMIGTIRNVGYKLEAHR